jgi:type IV pilus assembly protein PilC
VAEGKDENLHTFQYEAITPAGNRIKGTRARMVAYNKEIVRRELIDQGFIPISITQINPKSLNRSIGQPSAKRLKMKTSVLAAFTRQFHELLRAGIPAPRALTSLAEEAPSAALQELCVDLSTKITSGVPIGECFAQYPRAFNDIYCAYLAAGERTGAIVESTGRLAKLLERQAKMRNKIVAVATYPLLVGGIILLLMIGIMVFLVPQFASVYESFGAELPAPTQRLIAISQKMPQYLALTAGLIFLARTQYKRAVKRSMKFAIAADKFKFRLPIFGKLIHRVALYRWATTLAGSLEAGLPQTQALEIAAAASGSNWIKRLTPGYIDSVTAGRPLSSLIGESGRLFPPQVRTMINTGEASGELARLLESAADSMDSDIEAMVATMGSKIEVFLLVFLAGSVGAILVVLYLPILSLASSVGDSLGNGG